MVKITTSLSLGETFTVGRKQETTVVSHAKVQCFRIVYYIVYYTIWSSQAHMCAGMEANKTGPLK